MSVELRKNLLLVPILMMIGIIVGVANSSLKSTIILTCLLLVLTVGIGALFGSPSYLKFLISGYVLFVITFPKAGIKIGDSPIIISMFFLAAAFVTWAIQYFKDRPVEIRRSITSEMVQRYLFIAAISILLLTLFSIWQTGTIPTLTRFLPIFLPVLILPIVYYQYRDEAELFSRLFFITFGLTVVYGVAQYIFGHYATIIPGLTVNYSDYQEHGNKIFELKMNVTAVGLKLVGTFQNGNLFGGGLIAGIIVMIGWLQSKTVQNKRLFTLVLLGALFCIVMTLSRSALVGLVVGLLAFSFLYRDMFKYVIIFVTLMIVVVYGFNLDERIFANDPTAAGRTPQYAAYLESLKVLPPIEKVFFFGMGKGMGYSAGSIVELGEFSIVESGILNLLTYTGILGLAIYFFPIIYGFLAIITMKVSESNKSHRIRSAAIVSALIGMWGQMAIDQLLNLPPTGFIYWLLVAWMFVEIRAMRKIEEIRGA